jgi:hypothetical protein
MAPRASPLPIAATMALEMIGNTAIAVIGIDIGARPDHSISGKRIRMPVAERAHNSSAQLLPAGIAGRI